MTIQYSRIYGPLFSLTKGGNYEGGLSLESGTFVFTASFSLTIYGFVTVAPGAEIVVEEAGEVLILPETG